MVVLAAENAAEQFAIIGTFSGQVTKLLAIATFYGWI
jgi:hypothetical protein